MIPPKKNDFCRSCGTPFNSQELLKFEKMPSMAQHLSVSPEKSSCVDFSVFQCPKCGLLQLNTPPVPYFREVIRAAAYSSEMGIFRQQQFDEWVRRNGLSGKKVLECGCGKGEYLELMARSGGIAYGMEYGDENVNFCKAKNLTVEKCYFETGDEKLINAPFDGFYILNYLEHLPNITEYLKGIYNNLSENACGLVEVPNFDMMLANNTFAEFMTDHLFYFTSSSLRTLLESNGFEVISENKIWYNYILSMEVRKRKFLDLSQFNTSRTSLTGELNKLIETFGKEHSAVWGASHQAFAILALAGLHEKVRCILDSAVFKQGKYSPATNIPIVSPECVAPNELKLLLVMAGGYSDEVAKIARKKFGNDLEIYILRTNKLERYENLT